MNDTEWLDKVVLAEKVYNAGRLHTDVQHDEVLKFIEYLHKAYGYAYDKPTPRHENMPHKKANSVASLG